MTVENDVYFITFYYQIIVMVQFCVLLKNDFRSNLTHCDNVFKRKIFTID